MTGDLTRKPPESGATDGCMGLLKTLQREEILEVLSDGICQHCLSLMETRIYSLLNSKISTFPLSFLFSFIIICSVFFSLNGGWFHFLCFNFILLKNSFGFTGYFISVVLVLGSV